MYVGDTGESYVYISGRYRAVAGSQLSLKQSFRLLVTEDLHLGGSYNDRRRRIKEAGIFVL